MAMQQDMRAAMSPRMRERYGLDRGRWTTRILASAVILGYAAAVIFVAVQLADRQVESQLLVWSQTMPDRVDVTFEVERRGGIAVDCVVRAQDADRTDLGYATTTVPAGPDYLQQTYLLRVLGPAAVVEVLACGPQGEPLRVPGPQFPGNIVPPQQPWTP